MSELVMKYQQYAEYKDSGVEWLGKIPSHWNLSSLKRCIDGCTNGIWGSEPEESSDNTVVLRVADFDRNKLEISEEKLTLRNISPKERESRLLRKGDLLIEKSGGGDKTLVGCVVLFDKDFRAVTSNFVAKMTPKIDYESNFLKYAFSLLYDGRVNYASIKQTTGIQNLDSDAYLMEKFVFPEKEEQTQIANFLDFETAQIDTLIEKQQTLIKLLKEKRQAVISHAVTKGLNTDAPMKDSGVEWLGQVPEHWSFGALKYWADIIDCKHITAEFVENGYPLASIGEVKGWTVDLSASKLTTKKFYLELIENGRKPTFGDILYSRNATVGEAALVVENMPDFAMGQDICLIRSNDKILSEYILYVLNSGVIKNQLDLAMVGSTFKRINVDNIRNFDIAFPSLCEQQEIIDWLKIITNKYDDLTFNAEQAIQLMQERRTALISAAVTGKIDVRGWVAPESR